MQSKIAVNIAGELLQLRTRKATGNIKSRQTKIGYFAAIMLSILRKYFLVETSLKVF